MVEELRVEEGDYVEAGQVIAALDVETLAELREEIDDARVKIQDAEDAIEDFNNPYTYRDVVLAEENVVKARVALRDAEDALEDLLELPDLEDELADAEWDVEKAKLDIAKAEDALAKLHADADPDDVEKAAAKIDSIEVSLENALQDLDLLDEEWEGKLDTARETEEDALSEYRDVVFRYLGAQVNDEESRLPPQEMISAWGTSLETLFTTPAVDSYDLAQHLQSQDDPGHPLERNHDSELDTLLRGIRHPRLRGGRHTSGLADLRQP